MTRDKEHYKITLGSSKNTLGDYLETMPAVLYEYCQYADGSGELIYVSPNVIELLGHPSDYFTSNIDHFWEMVHPEDIERLKMEDAASHREPSFSSDARIINRAGEEKWIRLISRPLKTRASTDSVTWIGSIVDVTHRSSVEMMRDELIDDLRISLGKLKSHDEDLFQANQHLEVIREKLELKNKQLDEFAQIAAHDLNGIINNIVGYVSILLEEVPARIGYGNYKVLEEIFSNATKMSDIIRDLLALSRLGRDAVQVSAIKMLDVFRSAESRLSQLILDKSAVIIVKNLSNQAIGYGPWLEEVWYNLLSNAIKYGGDPPVITVGAYKSGDMMTFWIQDNGKGLGKPELDQMFHPERNASLGIIKGHGLGLNIVRHIVEELDGNVGVSSLPGKGSRFRFSLPVIK